MADKAELEHFARALMQRVRDPAVDGCDRFAAGKVAGPVGEQWRALAREENVKEALRELIPHVVDEVLFELLDAIDNGHLDLFWRRADGGCVPLKELGSGEKAGWLMGSDGWPDRFSAQRFFDPYDNLELDLDHDDEVRGSR